MHGEKSELFKAAKAVDLDRFLESVLGVKPKRKGRWNRYSSCIHCGPSDDKSSVRLSSKDGYFSCFRCEQNGDVIKAAQLYYKVEPKQAAEKLVEGYSSASFQVVNQPSRTHIDQEKEDDAARHAALAEVLEKLIGLDLGSEPTPAVMQYLTVKRCIPRDIVMKAFQQGMILSLPENPGLYQRLLTTHVGEDLLRRSGLWRPGARMAGVVYRPLVFPMPGRTAAEFRVIEEKEGSIKAIRYGSKSKPWTWTGTDITKPVLIVEGMPDMLSAVALGHKGDVISVPGVNQWTEHAAEWFGGLVGRKVVVCFDNDPDAKGPIQNPGQHWAKRLIAVLRELGITDVSNRVLPPGQDINEILKLRTADATSQTA